MNDDSGTDSTSKGDLTGDNHPGGAEGNGPSDIPEETVSSESDLALDNQPAAKRESGREQGD